MFVVLLLRYINEDLDFYQKHIKNNQQLLF